MPTSSGSYSTQSAVRKLPNVGVSVSDPIGPSGDVHPAETNHVPPEQLPPLGALPDPPPMQRLASPLEGFGARIRELNVIFADLSSYTATLESRISNLWPFLPQGQRAELQVVEALTGAKDIEARLSLLEKVIARVQFALFDPHRGSAAASEEEVTGHQGGKNRKYGQESLEFILKDPRLTRKGSANLSATESRTINGARIRRSRTQSPTKKIRTTATSPMNWP
jgi:hypothetical protein